MNLYVTCILSAIFKFCVRLPWHSLRVIQSKWSSFTRIKSYSIGRISLWSLVSLWWFRSIRTYDLTVYVYIELIHLRLIEVLDVDMSFSLRFYLILDKENHSISLCIGEYLDRINNIKILFKDLFISVSV